MYLRLLCITSLLLGAVLVTGQNAKADDATDKLKGTWTLVSVESGGQKLEKKNSTIQTLTFDGKDALVEGKKLKMKGTYKFDTTQKPAYLEITVSEGPHKGDMHKMIAQLDGDTLKVATDKDGKSKPKSFDDKDIGVLTFQRSKK